ncbi:TIGR01777 family oxidoreductase [bacterium]|nr:TIGR01777 family oxidoreductase [bacterium]
MGRRILISGASGLIGQAISQSFPDDQIYKLVRHQPKNKNEIFWDIEKQVLDPKSLENFDVVIHLSGENIAAGRWTDKQKKKIIDSRILSTRLLCGALNKVKNKPAHYLQASAIGYYGLRGDEKLDEKSEPGTGFLPEVCVAWENETKHLKNVPITYLRTGIVLSLKGGALSKMYLPFKMGAGGVVGSGQQYMSWIDLDDWINSFQFIVQKEITGPVNLVSPQPVTNKEFTATLGKVLKRPTVLPVPGFALKLALGEMAQNLLLGSTRVYPHVLTKVGFQFQYPNLENCLQHCLVGAHGRVPLRT